jgi:hypothetical protein
MHATMDTPGHERRQYLAFGVLSLVAAGFTAALSLPQGGARFFEAYFGSIPPLLAIALTALVGFGSLAFLHSRGWFEIYTSRSVRGVGFSAGIATLFGVWQVCADLLVTRFPRDINVPSPQSWLFYPAIAYVVEVFFHALPLALLLAVLGRSIKKSNTTIVIWLCIVFVSSLEPVLVHMRMGSSAYVGVFVFVFTVVELYVFRRYDFISMYSFRLVFYMWWHITWGYLRLRWLF